MTAMKLSRDPLIHPVAVVICLRFAIEIAARAEALAWWDPNHPRLHAALGNTRHRAIEASLDRNEPA